MTKYWTCEKCGKPIISVGYVNFRNNEGGYPSGPCREEVLKGRAEQFVLKRHKETGRNDGILSLEEHAQLDAFSGPTVISIRHAKCEIDEPECYYIDVHQCSTGEQMLATVQHLLGKTWFGRVEALHFIGLWRSQRAETKNNPENNGRQSN